MGGEEVVTEQEKVPDKPHMKQEIGRDVIPRALRSTAAPPLAPDAAR